MSEPSFLQRYVAAMKDKLERKGHRLVRLESTEDVRRFFEDKANRSEA
ncbi:hypothetical protein LCGC14_1711340 [marine sediment metagenome]|uniref:Uncharacterized protein n=1 Tax=marine sediment metagenome TaxID=412755 RepID=A0A0F9JVI8_9ZZZZ